MRGAPTAYSIRRALRAPRAYYLRHRESDIRPDLRALYEHFSYSRAIRAMVRTIERNPDLLVDFELDDRSVVIDAGAYVGEWSERISRRSAARVYAFEPSPVPLKSLYQRVAGHPNVSVFEYGLGARDETATLTLQGPGSSVHDDVNTSRFERAPVPIRDVAAVLRELRLDNVDLLKLNIEGSEYDVLERLAETAWLPRIGIVLVQFHEWLPRVHRRRRALQRVLARTHTQLWDYPWVWEAWRRSVGE